MLDEFFGNRHHESFRMVKLEYDIVFERASRIARINGRYHNAIFNAPKRVLTKNQFGQRWR